jgi:hypothetical protein
MGEGFTVDAVDAGCAATRSGAAEAVKPDSMRLAAVIAGGSKSPLTPREHLLFVVKWQPKFGGKLGNCRLEPVNGRGPRPEAATAPDAATSNEAGGQPPWSGQFPA